MALGRWFVLSFCPRGWGLGWGWGRLLIEGGGEDVLKIEDEPGPGVVQALFHPNFLKDTIQLDEKDNLLNGFEFFFFSSERSVIKQQVYGSKF